FSRGDQLVILTPVTQPLSFNTTFTLDIGTGITDLAGNALVSVLTTTFTTLLPDVTPPRVASVLPANGATTAPVAAFLPVAFTKPIGPATVTPAAFQGGAGATPVAGSFSFFNNNTTVRFAPAAPLPFGTLMTVQLTATITDVLSNPL